MHHAHKPPFRYQQVTAPSPPYLLLLWRARARACTHTHTYILFRRAALRACRWVIEDDERVRAVGLGGGAAAVVALVAAHRLVRGR